MRDYLTFEILAPDALTGERWSFFLLRNTLVVDSYSTIERPSKRHQFRTVKFWSRHASRSATLRQNEVPLTEAVAAEAKERFLREIAENLAVSFAK